MKSKGGLQRISRAMGYTVEGLKAAYKHEHAFRQEVFAVALLPSLPGYCLIFQHGFGRFSSALYYSSSLSNC